jgi:hypothetical protein
MPPHSLQIDSHGQPALVSHLSNGKRHYIIVQNTNPNRGICVDIRTDEQIQRLRGDGTSVQASLYDTGHYLEAGMVEIFYYE